MNSPILTTFSDDVFELQARLCQTMSHVTRLKIVHELRVRPRCVNELTQAIGLGSTSISHHLAALRESGIVVTTRQGQQIVYELANPRIVAICDLVREVLVEQATHQSEIAKAMTE